MYCYLIMEDRFEDMSILPFSSPKIDREKGIQLLVVSYGDVENIRAEKRAKA